MGRLLSIPQKWVEQSEPGGAAWVRANAKGLCRVWPNAPEQVDCLARAVGVSWKLPVTRFRIEQSADTYAFDGSDHTYDRAWSAMSAAEQNAVWTVLTAQGVDFTLVFGSDALKLYYLCGADKTDTGPREHGWFGPAKQLLACALRFRYWYRGENGPATGWENWLGLREDPHFAPGVPVERAGVTIIPTNQASADALRYTTSMPAQEHLREIGMRWFPDDYANEEGASSVTAPTIVDRHLKFPRPFTKRKQTDRIMVHHSASKTGDAKTFHAWHLGQGWNGIGYHYVICIDGTIEQGRPSWAISANTLNHNYHTLGVNLVGDFTSSQPTEEQVRSLVQLLAWLCDEWGLKPGAILGHRDLNQTSCPGDAFYPRLPAIRALVATMLGAPQTEDSVPFAQFGDNDARDGGNDVRRVQAALNAKGYVLEEDGDFGRLTLAAVTAFQEKHELQPDGVVGPLTWAALKAA